MLYGRLLLGRSRHSLMRSRVIPSLLLCGLLLLSQTGVAGFETDQYNLPPRPLADIGDEVTEHVEQKLRQAIEKINAEISTRQNCLTTITARKKSGCESTDKERAKLVYLRSPDEVARRVSHLLG